MCDDVMFGWFREEEEKKASALGTSRPCLTIEKQTDKSVAKKIATG